MDGGGFGDFEIIHRRSADVASVPDDPDDVDETLAERLLGLTEMFPKQVRDVVETLTDFSAKAVKGTFKLAQSAVWIIAASSTVLFLPYLIERERLEMEQMQRQHERQIMLGPSAAMSGVQGSMGGPGARLGLMPQVATSGIAGP